MLMLGFICLVAAGDAGTFREATKGTYLRAAGEEGFDVDVGIVDLEVVIPEPSGHADGGQHPGLQNRGCVSLQGAVSTSSLFLHELQGRCATCYLFSFPVDQRELEIFIVDGLVGPALVEREANP